MIVCGRQCFKSNLFEVVEIKYQINADCIRKKTDLKLTVGDSEKYFE